MQLRQSNALQALTDIQRFLDEHPEELSGVIGTGTRKKLDKLIGELTQVAVVQSQSHLGAKASTQRVRALTQVVIGEFMAPIAHIAATELAPLPELSPLAMPKSRIVGQRLVGFARGMAAEAAKNEQVFVEAGLPEDFIKKFTAAIDALAKTANDRKQREGERGSATGLLPKLIVDAGRLVTVIDDFMKVATRGNRQLLGEWKIVKRYRRTPAARASAPVEAGGVA